MLLSWDEVNMAGESSSVYPIHPVAYRAKCLRISIWNKESTQVRKVGSLVFLDLFRTITGHSES